MTINSLPIVGSLAGAPLAQKGSDVDKAKGDVNTQQRAADASAKAEAAAGIGVTQEDSQAEDRDADGRRPWELGGAERVAQPTDGEESAAPPRSKDPTGQSGQQLDLSG